MCTTIFEGFAWIQHRGSKLDYGVIAAFVVDYPSQCQRTCLMNDECDSINYRPLDNMCQLIKQHDASAVNSTDIMSDNDWEWWSDEFTVVINV
jgi:hypothetical protein